MGYGDVTVIDGHDVISNLHVVRQHGNGVLCEGFVH